MNKLKKYLTIILTIFAISGTFEISNTNVVQATANIPNIQIGNDNNISNGLQKSEVKGKLLNKILTEYRGVVVFISGIARISMIMFFIFNFIELGNSKGNPQARQKAINGLIISGIATAGLGSVTLITQLFYNMIN